MKLRNQFLATLALSFLGCKPSAQVSSPNYDDANEVYQYVKEAETSYPQTKLVPTFVDAGDENKAAWMIVLGSIESVTDGSRRFKLLDPKRGDDLESPIPDAQHSQPSHLREKRGLAPQMVELTPIVQEHPDLQPDAWTAVLSETPTQFSELEKWSPAERKKHVTLLAQKAGRLLDCTSVFISKSGKNTVIALVANEDVVKGALWSNQSGKAYGLIANPSGSDKDTKIKELVQWLANAVIPAQ